MALNGNANGNGMQVNGHGHGHTRPVRPDSHQMTTATRERKLLTTPDLDKRNGKPSPWPDDSSEWKTRSIEILPSKQKINFESCNSISIPINFSEAWSFFESCDMSEYMNRVDRNPPVNTLRTKFHVLLGHPPLKSSLVPEKELILAVAACPMNNECSVHRRILQSIYVFMTKNPICSRFGSHWEEVGFQGQDPASDLRGVGMFGALQMLHFSFAPETKHALAPDFYELSRHPEQQFPLAVLSLNVSRMTLDALRDGLLNRFCNKKSDCIWIVNRFYLAIMYRIYKKWKDKSLTIHDSCYLLKAVEKFARAHPQKTFSRLNEYLAQNESIVEVTKPKKHGFKKLERFRLKSEANDLQNHSQSWLDLTKPSLEVFI